MDTHRANPLGRVARFVIGTVAAILVSPFIALALAPTLLALAPVAFIAIPFMLLAFAVEAREVAAARRCGTTRRVARHAGVADSEKGKATRGSLCQFR
jgi:hypothetical protein